MSGGKPDWLDLRLSLGNIITIAVVAAGIMAGWFQFDTRVTRLEDGRAVTQLAFDELKGRVTQMERERNDLSARVIRIEEKLSSQNDLLGRILRNTERARWPDQQ